MSKADAPDAENPEWTEERMRNAIPFSALPDSVKNAILKIKRGPQKAAKKVPSPFGSLLMLSPDCERLARAGRCAPMRR